MGLLDFTLQRDSTAWRKWEVFFTWLYIPPYFRLIKDTLAFLHIFVEWVFSGVLTTNQLPIQKCIVELYLRSFGVIFASVGTIYPRIKTVGSLEFWMGRHPL